jgi:hypothetical protein
MTEFGPRPKEIGKVIALRRITVMYDEASKEGSSVGLSRHYDPVYVRYDYPHV